MGQDALQERQLNLERVFMVVAQVRQVEAAGLGELMAEAFEEVSVHRHGAQRRGVGSMARGHHLAGVILVEW